MPSLRLGIWATATYSALIAFATYYLFHLQNLPSDLRGVMIAILPVQLSAVAFCVLVIITRTGWRAAGLGRIRWSGLIWFLPAWAVLIFMGLGIAETVTQQDLASLGRYGFALLAVTTLLIAFGEEVIFRGFLLRGAMRRLSIPSAMLLSTVLFGLFHLVNGLAGQGAVETSQQVLFAVIVGFFLAPIAVRLGSLWPLIIWHWFWNIAVILGQTAGLLHPLTLVGIAVQAIVSIWLWADLARHRRPR